MSLYIRWLHAAMRPKLNCMSWTHNKNVNFVVRSFTRQQFAVHIFLFRLYRYVSLSPLEASSQAINHRDITEFLRQSDGRRPDQNCERWRRRFACRMLQSLIESKKDWGRKWHEHNRIIKSASIHAAFVIILAVKNWISGSFSWFSSSVIWELRSSKSQTVDAVHQCFVVSLSLCLFGLQHFTTFETLHGFPFCPTPASN